MGSVYHGYICIVLYMKVIWCNGFPHIYAQLEEGMGSICHRYMCIVLYIIIYIYIYMKLIWNNGYPEMYG